MRQLGNEAHLPIQKLWMNPGMSSGEDSTYPPPCHNTYTRRDYIIIQRLAVARTFMRTSSMERGVGLLLFDEPSTSLDPTAKHNAISLPSASVSFVLL